jgi:nitrate/nitrite transport system substrate-binding protein
MVANMKVDKWMDSVSAAWNYRAIEDKIGFTVITIQQMWKDSEKVCATEEFATKNLKTVKAILKALHLSSQYLDKMENRVNEGQISRRPISIARLNPRQAAREVQII